MSLASVHRLHRGADMGLGEHDVDMTARAWSDDQAAGLRRLFAVRPSQLVAFAAGLEACGRTSLIVESAEALAAAGWRVLIIDENPAPQNILTRYGLAARHDLLQLLHGERSLSQVEVPLAPQLSVVAAARALQAFDMAASARREQARSAALALRNLGPVLAHLQQGVDFILIDSARQSNGLLTPLTLAAPHMVVVAAATSATITHAYALIKRLARERGRADFQVVINRARTLAESRIIFDNMRRVAEQHLTVRLNYLAGVIPASTTALAHALLERLPIPPALTAAEQALSSAARVDGRMSAPLSAPARVRNADARGALNSVL